jgi:UDP-N-acetylmuramate--L-alanine ligase/UDP-N-acetylenolpyruvoylglucosamine reductase
MDTGQILAEILVGGDLRVHLIGVAGSGMSGIAALLLSLGHEVSGSDKVTTLEVERLQKLGLEFHCPHEAASLKSADLVIFSSAIRPGNVEYDEALRTGISMVRRADALAAIMNCKKGIVIAGMHGKTTTSSMAAHVLRVGGLKPSHYVGAEIPILGTNAHWDAEGDFLVAEGDESDGTLANYHPEHAIILNIEEEHLDYYENLAAIEAVFNQLLEQTSGTVFYCRDDANTARLCATRPRAISFGEGAGADYQFSNFQGGDFQSTFDVHHRGAKLGAITLNVPGRHNASNAMSVIALAGELGMPFPKIAEALNSFRGAKRRFEIKHRSGQYMVVDDYAHHPSEIAATLATAKSGGRKRILVMFQPHRYSRTAALKEAFGKAFDDADMVFVTDIYPASEKPIEGVSGQTIVDAIAKNGRTRAHYVPERKKILQEVGRMLEPGDLVLSLGAGDIHEEGALLSKDLARLEELEKAMAGGSVRLYEPLARHTTLRVGGPAQFWAEPETEAAFARLVAHCARNQIPLMVMGRGSNLLVRDGGIRGVIAHLARGEFKKIEVNGRQITAGVGLKLKEVAYAARDAGIGGFEWMEGIPGNVGGALRMNAGAMGAETFGQVVSVRLVDAEGNFHTRKREELEVHYRDTPSLTRNYAVSATFEGHESTAEEISRLLDESMQKRRTTQPAASSAGCIFKNPAACPAGRLIDELGLKNLAVGGARVSEVHGNFIVNDGGATAADVLALIDKIKSESLARRGIVLETEVQIVGEAATLHG